MTFCRYMNVSCKQSFSLPFRFQGALLCDSIGTVQRGRCAGLSRPEGLGGRQEGVFQEIVMLISWSATTLRLLRSTMSTMFGLLCLLWSTMLEQAHQGCCNPNPSLQQRHSSPNTFAGYSAGYDSLLVPAKIRIVLGESQGRNCLRSILVLANHEHQTSSLIQWTLNLQLVNNDNA